LAVGLDTTADGHKAVAVGWGATANGAHSKAIGWSVTANGYASEAIGVGATASGAFSEAYGWHSTAYGYDAKAHGQHSTAIGAHTHADGKGSVAIGTDSHGHGAVASLRDQFVLGTSHHTYTAPGITSDLSKLRQSGPLEVVTSDRNGNLATDGGLLFEELSKLNGGVALAMALENPDLVAGEVFGIAGNMAYWEGNIALGFSAMGVLGHDLMGTGERWALSGAVGFTLKEESFGNRSSKSSIGGRAGLQITW